VTPHGPDASPPRRQPGAAAGTAPAGPDLGPGQPLRGTPPAVTVPGSVRALAGGGPVRPLWVNEAGGLAFIVGAGVEARFVKWAPAGSVLDLPAEAARLAWAADFTPVARPLGGGADASGTWLVTTVLAGENAVTPHWRARPRTAVTALGRGLRALHDALPVADCPFSWSAADRVIDARRRAAGPGLDPGGWHEIHRPLGVARALELAADVPPTDRLVVCHGDACAPNTMLDADGNCSAHVDLGDLGVADRWADLAVATWSTTWNYGPGWEHVLLDAYGVAPDPARTAYYRLLWDLGP
jgi:kanamycin kinase